MNKELLKALHSVTTMDGLEAVFFRILGQSKEEQVARITRAADVLLNPRATITDKASAHREITDLKADLQRYYPMERYSAVERESGFSLHSLATSFLLSDEAGAVKRLGVTAAGNQTTRFLDDHEAKLLSDGIQDATSTIKSIKDAAQRDESEFLKTLEHLKSEHGIDEKEDQLTALVAESQSIAKDQNLSPDIRKAKLSALKQEFSNQKQHIEDLYDQYIDPVYSQWTDEQIVLSSEDRQKIKDLTRKRRFLCVKMMRPLYDALIQESPVSQEEAEAWASMQQISPTAMNRLRRQGYQAPQLRRDLAEYYQLTQGRLDKVTISSDGSERAHAYIGRSEIMVDGDFDKTVLWHELSHLLEADPAIKALSNDFVKTRGTTGEPEPLQDITDNRRYRPSEQAIRDKFFDPYVGKVYDGGYTEVISMGMQQLTDPERMYALFNADREMFDMMIGLLTGMSGLERERQQRTFGEQLRGYTFLKATRKHLSSLAWTDAEAQRQQLHDYSIYPLQIAKRNGTPAKHFFGVEKGGRNLFYFQTEVQAKTYIYLSLLNEQGIQSTAEQIQMLVLHQRAPEWYREGQELPRLK